MNKIPTKFGDYLNWSCRTVKTENKQERHFWSIGTWTSCTNKGKAIHVFQFQIKILLLSYCWTVWNLLKLFKNNRMSHLRSKLNYKLLFSVYIFLDLTPEESTPNQSRNSPCVTAGHIHDHNLLFLLKYLNHW